MFPSLCHELTRNSRGNPICVLQSLPLSLQLSIHLGFLFFSRSRSSALSLLTFSATQTREPSHDTDDSFYEVLSEPSPSSPLQQSVGPDYSIRVSLASVDYVNDDSETVTSTSTWRDEETSAREPLWSRYFIDECSFSLSALQYSEYFKLRHSILSPFLYERRRAKRKT